MYKTFSNRIKICLRDLFVLIKNVIENKILFGESKNYIGTK